MSENVPKMVKKTVISIGSLKKIDKKGSEIEQTTEARETNPEEIKTTSQRIITLKTIQ